MSDLGDLSRKLCETQEQIARLGRILAERPAGKADEINMMSLQKRKGRLQKQIAERQRTGLIDR